MVQLDKIVAYCDRRLDAGAFEDYCPNGLQVEAGTDVGLIVSGVTASLALIDAAIEVGANLLLVHHGYFWRNEALPLTGIKGRRIRHLMQNGISLLAYHLPLDAHAELGNNRQFGLRLGLTTAAPLRAGELIWVAELDRPTSAQEFGQRVAAVLARAPLVIAAQRPIRRLAWCTGAAQDYLERAADAGVDAFISGEISESTVHVARERGVSYFAVGHHASERYGVQALGDELALQFGVRHRYIEIDNPV